MNINKMLKGAVAALTSAAALGALTAPAFAASGTYDLNGKGVDALSVHGGAQRIATIGNAKAKNVILFIGDGMGDSEITVARNYLHGVNGTFQGLDKIGQPGALQTSTGKAAESGVGQYTTFSLGGSSTRVLNRSATPCLGLEVFEVSNLRRCCTHGSTVFAPVVR